MTRLSVNINKVATLRNARGGNVPNVVKVALDCESFGADGITVHPRPDERHIRIDPALGQGDRLCHRLQQRGKLHPQLPQQRRHRPRPVPEAPDLTEKEQGVS